MRSMTFKKSRDHSFHIILAVCLFLAVIGMADISASASGEWNGVQFQLKSFFIIDPGLCTEP